MWHKKMATNSKELTKNGIETIKLYQKRFILILISYKKIFITLPLTTVTPERLKRLKVAQ